MPAAIRAPALAVIVAAACASRPPAPWIEEDFAPHATAPAAAPGAPGAPDTAEASASSPIAAPIAPPIDAPVPAARYPSADQAATALRAAIAAGRDVDVVVAGNALARHGGELAPHATAIAAAVDRLPGAALATVWRALDPRRAPAAAVALRLALIADHAGDRGAARDWLARARAAPDAAAYAPAMTALATGLDARVTAGRVAVLLPLTGRFAGLGAELRAAIALAPAPPAGWLWLDTAGDEARAEAMVDRAADAGVAAILGPVGEREALAAARRAVARGVPIALLAPADGGDPAAGVYRAVTSPADEARAAARLAAELSFPTAAVLAPRDEVGASMAAAFVAAAAAAGVAVTTEGSYDPTASDLEPDVKAFLGLDPARNERLRAHLRRYGKRGWQTFSPDVGFSLLYIPDQHDRAALVASFLPYLGVELRTGEMMDPLLLRRKHGGRIPQVVQLVGSSGWHHPGLLPRGGNAVVGAVIVDGCAIGDDARGGDAGAAFAERFTAATGHAPSTAAAQGHDAAQLVAAAAAAAASAPAGRDDPRGAMRAALRRARLDDGACGPAQIGPDGELTRAAFFFEVEADSIVPAPY